MKVPGLLLAGFVWAAAAASGQSDARVEDLQAQLDGDRLIVSFELAGGVDEAMVNRIQSGLPTTLLYHFRLHRPRTFWFDKTYDRSTLEVVAIYNAVTREYQVNFKHDGKLIDSRVVTDIEALRRAMTLIHSLEVFDDVDVEPRQRTQLMVRADFGSKHVLLLFPNRVNTPWARLRMTEIGGATAP